MRIHVNTHRFRPTIVGCLLFVAIFFLVYTKWNVKEVRPIKTQVERKPSVSVRFCTEHRRSKDAINADELETLRLDFRTYLKRLQNPRDCQKGKYLMCSIDAKCGFGCQLHRISWCMIHAVMENRTMVMRPNAIREYGRDTECGSHWNCWFDNVSGCQVYAAARKSSLKDQKDFKTYSENPFTKHKDWLPPVLVERGLKNMTEMPTAWFVGQIVGWLLKYADELNATIEDFKAEMNLTRPVDVSLHVRRTDKVQAHRGEQTEAASHTFQEYMQHVDHLIYPNARHHDYYAEHEHTPVNIYVATDDPTLPNDFSNYPRYNFIYDERGMALASKQNTRYNAESLDRLLLDLRMMSEAEFFVGTFSSQISRIVVELMMARGLPDVPRRVHSVDAVYYAAE